MNVKNKTKAKGTGVLSHHSEGPDEESSITAGEKLDRDVGCQHESTLVYQRSPEPVRLPRAISDSETDHSQVRLHFPRLALLS